MTSADLPARIGRYRILSELGRGAMGVVYKGEDEALGRAVAVKTVLMSFASEEHAGYLARFRQEARALGALNHPAIIGVYDFGDEGQLAYIAMELLEGRDLRALMAESKPPLELAVDLAAQVAEGLAYAHARGIVHRDVKPANIRVVEGGRAKIMDFGIARVRASDVKTQTGLMLGSPKYMSPEQIMGQPADHRSDVFSLGVVLYEMLAGVTPFTGADIPQLMYQVCNARPTPPSHVDPRVPSVLDLIVAKALEKDADGRYQDAAEMAADLRKCLAEVPRPAATPPAPPEADPGEAPGARTIASTLVVPAANVAAPAPALGLLPWRRFDSATALARLASPAGTDRALLAPVPSGLRRWRADAQRLAGAGAIGAAAAIALALVLL